MAEMEYWHAGLHCCNERWERAYERFETGEQEQRKFRKRFERLGLDRLQRDAVVVDLFCGRGNGLRVLKDLGFTNLTGVDLSPHLLGQAPDGIRKIVADCTDLTFEADSVDVFIVQGGLHHLPELGTSLPACLSGISRALVKEGSFYVVEPWETPFLKAVHWITRQGLARRCVSSFDAFATMVEEEWDTYRQWLDQPEQIRSVFADHFELERWKLAGGKLEAIVRKR